MRLPANLFTRLRIQGLARLCTYGLALWVCSVAQAQDYKTCRPLEANAAQLVEIAPQFHTVRGNLADFDPCHRSVEFSTPSFFAPTLSALPPLVIIAHGGGGPGAFERAMARAFNQRGFATLIFDAYEMNGFNYKGSSLFLTGTTNGARQRMIYKSTWGAYQWALIHPGVNKTAIFFQGLSNGASVVLNMAAAVDPQHVKGVLAEGAPAAGIGFPDKPVVPVRLIYGKKDNYGGETETDWMLTRKGSCQINDHYRFAPTGVAAKCSRLINSEQQMPSPLEWFEQQKQLGTDIALWQYEDAAHGIMQQPIRKEFRVYGASNKRFGWTGSEGKAQELMLEDMMRFMMPLIKATSP
jgi:dienelactone hydrolase